MRGVPGGGGERGVDEEDVEVDFVPDLGGEAGEEWREWLGVNGTREGAEGSAAAFDGCWLWL